VAAPCEHDNEPSGSIRGGEFLDKPSDFNFSRRTLLHEIIFTCWCTIRHFLASLKCLYVNRNGNKKK
jgi:hypothetical protein